MEYDVGICKLSLAFYQAYPCNVYPEILHKADRPYTCLLIDTHEDYLICIPFRSDMRHNQGFHFSNTVRSSHSQSGLDYKKIVLVKDDSYIDKSPAVVDSDEYASVITNIQGIIRDVESYIEVYCRHVDGSRILHPRQFARKYQYATLPYFHDILGLNCGQPHQR